MSNFIPPNIIQTPDFAGLAKERIDRKRQEESSKNAYLDQFSEAQGLYLDGDRPAVQDAWDKVQSTIDMVAESDSPEARRQLKQVYADYSKVAGTAQVLADQHRAQVAGYKADPTKYAMSGGDFFSWDEEYRTKTRSFDDMQSALDNPNVLPSSASYALLNPYDQAQTLMGETANVASSFYDASGSLDAKGLRDRVSDIARKKIMGNPEAIERAIIWGATTRNNQSDGFAGDGDGKINSLEELNMIKELPAEEREKYMEAYITALVDDYVELTPGSAETGGGKQKLSGYQVTQQVEGTIGASGPAPAQDVNLDMTVLPGTVKKGGLGFTEIGVGDDGKYYVTVETKVDEKYVDDQYNEQTRSVTQSETREANPQEVAAIVSTYGNKYDLSFLNIQAEPEAEEAIPAVPAEAQAATETEVTTEEVTTEDAAPETTTTVTMDPADDALGIFESEEAPADTDKSFAYADLDDTGKKAVQKLRLKQQLEIGGQFDRERSKSITFTKEERNILSRWMTTDQMRKGRLTFKDVPRNPYDIPLTRVKKSDNSIIRQIIDGVSDRISVKGSTDKETTEEAPVEAPSEETQEVNRDYVLINGMPIYRDEYQKRAGTLSSIGTRYPDTLEEYAKRFGESVKNEADEPLKGEEISEATVTGGKDERTIKTAQIIDRPENETGKSEEVVKTEVLEVVEPISSSILSEMTPSVKGSGERKDGKTDYQVYRDRKNPIGAAEGAKEGTPSPVLNPSSTESNVYYAKDLDEDFKWTPETVQKAFDRWNANVPIEPEVWIEVANKFGIPVELMIAMAAQEGSVGRGERQQLTKNFFNWGNTTKGDDLPTGSKEQDKYNRYFKTWEDGLMTWADGFVRMYRPDSGDWSELWSDSDTFVTQRKTPKAAKGSRYAEGKEYESKIKEILDYSFKKQFGNNYQKKD